MKNILFSLRKLKRNKLLLYVGIPGLAIGLAVVLLLVSYLKREYSFDQHFTTKNQVVRLFNTITEGGEGTYGICLRKSYDDIPSQVAEVQAATQIYNGWTGKLTAVETDQSFEDLYKLFVDKEFFQVFDQKLLVGDSKTALQGKNKIVLTQSAAQKLFGTTDCVGKQIYMEFFGDPNHTVSGVVADLPDNSHIKYDFLVSMETMPLKEFNAGLEFRTYFLVKDNADVQLASQKIAKANDEVMQAWSKNIGVKTVSETVLLKDLHFFDKGTYEIVPTINRLYLWVIGSIAALVLLIALVNFMNLYSLHSGNRIGEIAMRKSLGASRSELARLFFSDTSLMALLAFVLALGLTALAAPYFSTLLSSKVSLGELLNPTGIIIVLGLLFVIVFISAAYPLLSLSQMKLALGVKGKTDKVNRKNYATKTALVLQFGITAFLIAGVVIFYAQVRHMKAVPLGFNPNNVSVFHATSRTLMEKVPSLKTEIAKLPFVEMTASSDHTMGRGCSGQIISKYGSDERPMSIDEYRVQSGFAKLMQMELLDGDYFSADNAKNEVILNESAIKKLGLKLPLAGQKINYKGEKIIKGVVKDFYYTGNSGKTIAPLVLAAYLAQADALYVRTSTPMTPDQKIQIVNIFKQFDDTYVFAGFNLRNSYNNKFQQENKIMKMVGTGALLAILLSISGLVALSLLNVNRRTKEIGVRKVMGSSEKQILILLIKQVLVWVIVACFIGFLVNYYVMQQALQNFVNRVSLSPIYFVISGVAVLLVAVLAVSWQSYRAASRNPVEALRYE